MTQCVCKGHILLILIIVPRGVLIKISVRCVLRVILSLLMVSYVSRISRIVVSINHLTVPLNNWCVRSVLMDTIWRVIFVIKVILIIVKSIWIKILVYCAKMVTFLKINWVVKNTYKSIIVWYMILILKVNVINAILIQY